MNINYIRNSNQHNKTTRKEVEYDKEEVVVSTEEVSEATEEMEKFYTSQKNKKKGNIKELG